MDGAPTAFNHVHFLLSFVTPSPSSLPNKQQIKQNSTAKPLTKTLRSLIYQYTQQTLPYSSKYLLSTCLDPPTPPEKAFRGSKHLLTMYLEDFGRLGLHTFPVHSSILGEVRCCQTINPNCNGGENPKRFATFPSHSLRKQSGGVLFAGISYGSRPAGLDFTDGFVFPGSPWFFMLVYGHHHFLVRVIIIQVRNVSAFFYWKWSTSRVLLLLIFGWWWWERVGLEVKQIVFA